MKKKRFQTPPAHLVRKFETLKYAGFLPGRPFISTRNLIVYTTFQSLAGEVWPREVYLLGILMVLDRNLSSSKIAQTQRFTTLEHKFILKPLSSI